VKLSTNYLTRLLKDAQNDGHNPADQCNPREDGDEHGGRAMGQRERDTQRWRRSADEDR
jgi:hypothetical protein